MTKRYSVNISYFLDDQAQGSQSFEEESQSFDSKAEADNYIQSIAGCITKHVIRIQMFETKVILGCDTLVLISDSQNDYNVNSRY